MRSQVKKTKSYSNEESSRLLSKGGHQKQSDITRQWVAVDGPGFLSPDKIDVDILNELPPDIRNQIWSDLKKTSVNFKSKLKTNELFFILHLQQLLQLRLLFQQCHQNVGGETSGTS